MSKVNLPSSFEQTSPKLYTKIQPQSFLGSREEDFYVFLPYTRDVRNELLIVL